MERAIRHKQKAPGQVNHITSAPPSTPTTTPCVSCWFYMSLQKSSFSFAAHHTVPSNSTAPPELLLSDFRRSPWQSCLKHCNLTPEQPCSTQPPTVASLQRGQSQTYVIHVSNENSLIVAWEGNRGNRAPPDPSAPGLFTGRCSWTVTVPAKGTECFEKCRNQVFRVTEKPHGAHTAKAYENGCLRASRSALFASSRVAVW